MEERMLQANGEFEVDLRPLDSYFEGGEGARFARMSIDKRFRGDLDGVSRGEMLSVRGDVEGSAGYVALERVRGALHGRRGTFVLQHFGTMDRGESRLVLEVVPDSGTGELEHLSGSMSIRIEDGKHLYDFVYSLEKA